jgi:hypothetical protein
MITMLSNSQLQQHNVNRLTFQITMKVVSEDSSCSMAWWGARAACAEVSTGQRRPESLATAKVLPFKLGSKNAQHPAQIQ